MKKRAKRSCLKKLRKGVAWTKASTSKKKWLVEKGGRMFGPYNKTDATRATKRCGGRVVFGA